MEEGRRQLGRVVWATGVCGPVSGTSTEKRSAVDAAKMNALQSSNNPHPPHSSTWQQAAKDAALRQLAPCSRHISRGAAQVAGLEQTGGLSQVGAAVRQQEEVDTCAVQGCQAICGAGQCKRRAWDVGSTGGRIGSGRRWLVRKGTLQGEQLECK